MITNTHQKKKAKSKNEKKINLKDFENKCIFTMNTQTVFLFSLYQQIKTRKWQDFHEL